MSTKYNRGVYLLVDEDSAFFGCNKAHEIHKYMNGIYSHRAGLFNSFLEISFSWADAIYTLQSSKGLHPVRSEYV